MAKGKDPMFYIDCDSPVRGRAVLLKMLKIPPVRNCVSDYAHHESN